MGGNGVKLRYQQTRIHYANKVEPKKYLVFDLFQGSLFPQRLCRDHHHLDIVLELKKKKERERYMLARSKLKSHTLLESRKDEQK